jgi:predicted nucleic acid-binding Zn ribbon protein
MPTYVYKFIDTGETIEVQQAFTDEAHTEIAHPTTGAMMKVKKVFTPIGVTFKGGGFYKTDSRPSGSSASSGSSGSASTPAAAPSSGGDSSSSSTGSTGSGSTTGGSSTGGSSTGGASSSGTSTS